jgi:hygromycin-B 7''-O-kinase
MALRPPTFGPGTGYGEVLGDPAFWAPYVNVVVAGSVEPPAQVGSFPTFRVGDVFVKLFCEGFDGAACHRVELAMDDVIKDVDAIPAPRVLDNGELFSDESWSWPYLVFTVIRGGPARRQPITARGAADLGEAIAALHALPAPLEPALHAVPTPCAKLSLPKPLADLPLPEVSRDDPVVLHADLHADHIFLDADGRLTGIIDWGDAFVANRYYELAALHLGLFFGDAELLGAFLDSYRWPADADFARRALDAARSHEFDVFNELTLPPATTLDGLATALFGVSR